jgi:hypothetical protein
MSCTTGGAGRGDRAGERSLDPSPLQPCARRAALEEGVIALAELAGRGVGKGRALSKAILTSGRWPTLMMGLLGILGGGAVFFSRFPAQAST